MHRGKENGFLHTGKKGQTFQQYKSSNPIRRSVARYKIYLLPVGDFTDTQQKILGLTKAYVEIYFQTPTFLLPPIPDTIIPASARRLKQDNNTQLLAPYLLDTVLPAKLPKDGMALMAISAKDIYPKAEWNYIFGLASAFKSVGISSIYRLQNNPADTTGIKLCLSRLINITTHELGHILYMRHCIFATCVMNGSNSLSETDRVPNRLCAECQKKLYWNFRYDNRKRLDQLKHYF